MLAHLQKEHVVAALKSRDVLAVDAVLVPAERNPEDVREQAAVGKDLQSIVPSVVSRRFVRDRLLCDFNAL